MIIFRVQHKREKGVLNAYLFGRRIVKETQQQQLSAVYYRLLVSELERIGLHVDPFKLWKMAEELSNNSITTLELSQNEQPASGSAPRHDL